jgi:RHS repeat-associated protein
VNNYTWNAEALMASANSTNYTYDGDRKRVEKSNGTLYWYGPSGEILEETDLSGNLRHDYIYFGGRRIARQDGTGATTVYYYFQDHLGTGLMMVDAWGHVQQQSVYYPFGGERVITNNVANNYKFTGLERDSETGLDHTLNRQYSSTLGRWLSPDPVRGCVMNPQKFDRYSYVLDNPTTLTDTEGNQPDLFQNPDCSDVEFATSHAECRTIPDPSGLQDFGDEEEPCSDFFFFTTHAECGPPSGPFVNPDMLDLIELRELLREDRAERKADGCTERTSDKPIMFNLCADAGKDFVQAWTCEGGAGSRDCCLTKETAFTKSCEKKGKAYSAEVHNSLWGSMEADCCKEKAK